MNSTSLPDAGSPEFITISRDVGESAAFALRSEGELRPCQADLRSASRSALRPTDSSSPRFVRPLLAARRSAWATRLRVS
jgi:hypothetical protein